MIWKYEKYKKKFTNISNLSFKNVTFTFIMTYLSHHTNTFNFNLLWTCLPKDREKLKTKLNGKIQFILYSAYAYSPWQFRYTLLFTFYHGMSGFGILSSSFSYIVLSLYICQDRKVFFLVKEGDSLGPHRSKTSQDYRMWGRNVGSDIILSVEGCCCVEEGWLVNKTESLEFQR